MATSFSSMLGSSRSDAFAGAMQAMGGNDFGLPDPRAGAARRQQAIEKANAWSERGVSAMGGMGDQMAAMQGQAANAGMQMVATDAIHEANMEAARAAQSAQGLSGAIGIGTSILGMVLCERRLKTNIHSLDTERAWRVVRDLPLYGFSYKAAPGRLAYGPMVDEVEPIDQSLVRPSLLPPDEDGEVRGFDTMRHQAYESLALQQALHRIEALESSLVDLQDAVARMVLSNLPPAQLALVEAA